MAEKTAATAEVARKITVKTVMGAGVDIVALSLKTKKSVALCQIYGAVTAIKAGQSDLGPFVRFVGEFKGINLNTGEVFQAPACILPRFLEEQLAGVCTPENFPVAFGFNIGVKYDDTVAGKYVYTATPLVQPKSSNVMTELENALGSQLKLPAPAKK